MQTSSIAEQPLTQHLKSCFLLLSPMLVWNAAMTEQLPEAFFRDVDAPVGIELGEIVGRLLTFGLPMFIPLRLELLQEAQGGEAG